MEESNVGQIDTDNTQNDECQMSFTEREVELSSERYENESKQRPSSYYSVCQ